MTTLSNIFQKLCCKITILLLSLLIELIILIWRQTSHHKPPFTTRELLKCIEEKNPTIFYTKNLKNHHHECTVCLSELEDGQKVRSLKCKHMFHKDCLDKWLQESMPTCPLCRKQVLPDDVVFKHRQMKNQQQEGFDEENDEQLPYILFALRGGNTSRLPRYI